MVCKFPWNKKSLWIFANLFLFACRPQVELHKKDHSSNLNLQETGTETEVEIGFNASEISSLITIAESTAKTVKNPQSCKPPAILVNTNCYSSYNAISNQTDCEGAGAYWLSSGNNGTCYIGISAIPQASCVSPFVYANGVCYQSAQAQSYASGCLNANMFYMNNANPSANNCVAKNSLGPLSLISADECNSVLMSTTNPRSAIWVQSSEACYQSANAISNPADCTAIGGTWGSSNVCVLPNTPAVTNTQLASSTQTSSQTTSQNVIVTNTQVASVVNTQTATYSVTYTQTQSSVQTASATLTQTQIATQTVTQSFTQTQTQTQIATQTVTQSLTETQIATATNTQTQSSTNTGTAGVTQVTCPGSTCTPSFGSSAYVYQVPVNTANGSNWTASNLTSQGTFIADMDGDGFTDIVLVDSAYLCSAWILFNQQGSSNSVNQSKGFIAKQYSLSTNGYACAWGSKDEVFTMPINGKKASIFTYSSPPFLGGGSPTAFVYTLPTDPNATALTLQTWTLNSKYGNLDLLWFGNFDGSGPGVASVNSGNIVNMSFFNNGSPRTANWTMSPAPSTITGNTEYDFAADINGDGLTEIILAGNANYNAGSKSISTLIPNSTNSRFTVNNFSAGPWGYSDMTVLGNFSGNNTNGQLDFLSPCKNAFDLNVFFSTNNTFVIFNGFSSLSDNWNCTASPLNSKFYVFPGNFTGNSNKVTSLLTLNNTNVSINIYIGSSAYKRVSLTMPSGFYLSSGQYLRNRGGSLTSPTQQQRGFAFAFDVYGNGLTDLLTINPAAGKVYVLKTSITSP